MPFMWQTEVTSVGQGLLNNIPLFAFAIICLSSPNLSGYNRYVIVYQWYVNSICNGGFNLHFSTLRIFHVLIRHSCIVFCGLPI